MRAIVPVPAAGSVRLAVVGLPAGIDPARRLRSVGRAAAAVGARRAAADRLRTDGLVVETPDAEYDRRLALARLRLRSYRVEAPGVGRLVVAGYGRLAGEEDCVRFRVRDGVRTALAALAAGDFDIGREVLTFLGRHQDAGGRIPEWCTTTGRMGHAAGEPTVLYLLLVARYLAWTGDRRTVRGEWARVERALEWWPETGGPLSQAVLAELVHTAEEVGETATARRLGSGGGGSAE
ncbi:MAG: hypothetical protein GWM90_07145, partial [Gemmatimonadetes bacterium]|nr:hypothetical protein [Gemmatimonadota bacterium]NIQ53601.1 hypothetical protein [Gemmatimonadota bacterium]NIU73762.1 hypothetical protein [Gammaproteobacteria bacterium]NIX43890.1 hypothetical protein [Gemmatimonadota bacterium]